MCSKKGTKMSLAISSVQNRNVEPQTPSFKTRLASVKSSKDFNISYNTAMAQKAAVMPAIYFGNGKEIILARKFDAIFAKYSKENNPLILKVKDGFSRQIAQRILTYPEKPIIIGIAGQSGSGKTTFLRQMKEIIPENHCRIILGDNYYKDTAQKRITEGGLLNMFKKGFSFDVPEAVELDLLSSDLEKLSKGESIPKLQYDFETGGRMLLPEKINPAKLIVVDSIFGLNEKLKDRLDIGVFVESKPETIEKRFFLRATTERGKTLDEAKVQYVDVTQKAQEHIIPTAQNANIIINGELPLVHSQQFFNEIHKVFK